MTITGVVPLICTCCGQVVGVENVAAWETRRAAEAHYFCRACMQLPEAEVEARLTANAAVAEAVWERVGAWSATHSATPAGAVAHEMFCGQPAVVVWPQISPALALVDLHRESPQ